LFGSDNSCYLSSWGVIISYIPQSVKLILTSISHVGYLCPSKDKFIEFSRHYSYHGLTKDCIIIFMVTLWHTPNSYKNCVWCDFSYWVQQAQLSTHQVLYIVIKDFNTSRNPLNFMFSVLIMVLSNLNSMSCVKIHCNRNSMSFMNFAWTIQFPLPLTQLWQK
jgi:hypothetical protein